MTGDAAPAELWQVALGRISASGVQTPLTDRAAAGLLVAVLTDAGFQDEIEPVDEELGIWLVRLTPEQVDALQTNGQLRVEWPIEPAGSYDRFYLEAELP